MIEKVLVWRVYKDIELDFSFVIDLLIFSVSRKCFGFLFLCVKGIEIIVVGFVLYFECRNVWS